MNLHHITNTHLYLHLLLKGCMYQLHRLLVLFLQCTNYQPDIFRTHRRQPSQDIATMLWQYRNTHRHKFQIQFQDLLVSNSFQCHNLYTHWHFWLLRQPYRSLQDMVQVLQFPVHNSGLLDSWLVYLQVFQDHLVYNTCLPGNCHRKCRQLHLYTCLVDTVAQLLNLLVHNILLLRRAKCQLLRHHCNSILQCTEVASYHWNLPKHRNYQEDIEYIQQHSQLLQSSQKYRHYMVQVHPNLLHNNLQSSIYHPKCL